MFELIFILENNKIEFICSKYAYYQDCIVIKKNHYKLEIYYDNGFVADLQKVPYTWGVMGSITLSGIINLLKNYLKIDLILNEQLSLF